MIEVGSTFAGYRLEQLLSTDTVSMTFRAVRRTSGARPVALRITHELRTSDGRPDAEMMARYIRRVSAALKVNHPSLVPIADAGEVGARVWVATALIEGVTLTRYIRDNGRLAGDDAVALMRDLADALDRAHAAAVVHGAISPRTIHVRRVAGAGEPTAVLHGFGIDTLLVRSVRHDRAAIDISDVAYVSPEYLRGLATDGRADQYALACALYHCIAGRPPFIRDTATGLFGAHMFTAPPHATGIDGDDRALAGALVAGMAKTPDERHESCVDLLRATGHASARRASAATGLQQPVPANQRGDGRAPTTGRAGTVPPRRRRAARVAPVAGAPGAAPTGQVRPVRASPGTATPTGALPGSTPGPAASPAPVHAPPATRRGRRGGATPPSRAADPSYEDRDARADAPARREPRILTWPVAAMIVLLGIISTMVLAALARQDAFAGLAGIVDTPADEVEDSAASSVDVPASAGVQWQRAVLDEPLYEVDVVDDAIVVTAPHRVAALDSGSGTAAWSRPIDVGVLTDMAATDSVVAVRAAKFRALSVADGALLWEKPDLVAPINSLSTAGTTIYGIGLGSVAPELVALNAIDGREIWRYDGGEQGIGDDASVMASDDIVAVLDGETLSVVDADATTDGGQPQARWQRPVNDPWLDSLALMPDAVVIADRGGNVCAYDPIDGTERWCEGVPGLPDGVPTVVAERDVIVVIVGSTVTSLALETGAQQWTFEAPRMLTPIAVSSGRDVIVTDVAGRVHGLDLARGFEGWRASGFGEVTALTATADAVYVGTRRGRLVHLRPPTEQPDS